MRLSNIQPTIPPNLFCKTNLFFPSPACHCIKRDSIIITEVLFCFQYSQINNNWPHFLANTVGYTTRTSLIGLFYTKCYSYFFPRSANFARFLCRFLLTPAWTGASQTTIDDYWRAQLFTLWDTAAEILGCWSRGFERELWQKGKLALFVTNHRLPQ